jgi:hypothetical protein
MGGTPLRHFGSGQVAGAATGGGPLAQSGSEQAAGATADIGTQFPGAHSAAVAAVAARVSEPAARAAEITALAATRLAYVLSMVHPLRLGALVSPTMARATGVRLKSR